MPTVDDLTISLTIKDNSNLDKLRKNLDAILKARGGAGGAGGDGGATGNILQIKKTLIALQDRMDFLIPTVSPRATDSAGIKEYGRTIASNIEVFKSEIAKFVTPEKLASLKGLAKDLNITELTTENMQYALEELMDKYHVIAQSIARGELIMTGSKAKKWLDVVAGVIKNIQGIGGVTSLRLIEKNLPESLVQKTLEALMKRAGIIKQGQFKMYEVGEGRYKEGDKERMEEWLGKEDEALMKKYGDMFKDESMYVGLMRALQDLGYKPEELQKLLTMVSEVEDNTQIEELVKTMFHLAKKGVIEDFWLPASLRDLANKLSGVQNVRELGEHTMTSLDINVMAGNIEKLRDIIPNISDETIKIAKELAVLPIELKTWLASGGTGNIPLQARIYGSKHLIVIASMISDEVKATLEKIGVEYFTIPNLKNMMVEAGITTDIESIEDLKVSMGKIREDLKMEEVTRILEKLDNKVATAKDIKELGTLAAKLDKTVQLIEKLYSEY